MNKENVALVTGLRLLSNPAIFLIFILTKFIIAACLKTFVTRVCTIHLCSYDHYQG